MSQTARWGRWSVIGVAILLLLWMAALIGGFSPDIRRLPINVHGPQVADYRAESPLNVAPLSPKVTKDASRDQSSSSNGGGQPNPGGSPSPSASGSGSPSPSVPATPSLSPSLPTLPVSTPTLPVATPTLPTATPTVVPTPTLPTPPPLP